jgi:hypothetical protein
MSKLIKKSAIQKETMPTFNIGPIRLKLHAGDINELICINGFIWDLNH